MAAASWDSRWKEAEEEAAKGCDMPEGNRWKRLTGVAGLVTDVVLEWLAA